MHSTSSSLAFLIGGASGDENESTLGVLNLSQTKTLFFNNTNIPKYAKAMNDFMRYLGKFKGFFCLGYSCFHSVLSCDHSLKAHSPKGHTSGFEDEEPMASTAI